MLHRFLWKKSDFFVCRSKNLRLVKCASLRHSRNFFPFSTNCFLILFTLHRNNHPLLGKINYYKKFFYWLWNTDMNSEIIKKELSLGKNRSYSLVPEHWLGRCFAGGYYSKFPFPWSEFYLLHYAFLESCLSRILLLFQSSPFAPLHSLIILLKHVCSRSLEYWTIKRY